ncbi:hypothetical protein GNZ12_37925 [Paraburkholderia sp. 1N]|uniref:Uncharacterized protein n=1 Tax=Paraburkholderia solitsugae TaxID=2675748 RepID=A0ABX2C1V4_9BURK|nr:hypothetical protein [Paraburkholderia solitsugae]NPT46984.1 hypothetical protein [Paraburkholderia solitsugae]
MRTPPKLQPWFDARHRCRLSHIHIQMARELGLNPRKFGSLANDQQEPWKRPLAEFIERCYSKRFGRSTLEHVQSLEEVVKRAEQRRSERRERKTNKAVPLAGPQRTNSGSSGKLPDLHEHGSE